MLDVREIVAAVRSVVGPGQIDLHVPCVGLAEAARASNYIKAGMTGYENVNRLQALLSEIAGVEQSVAVSSGTAALHLAYMAAGVEKDTEVLMPALTFVATASAAVYIGAIPHFIDTFDLHVHGFKLRQYLGKIAERKPGGTFNKKTDRRISALVVVDLLGHAADMTIVREVAAYYGLSVIEDAAQAIGSRDGNSGCGGRGTVGVFSFNRNKTVSTDGGGAVLTNDPFIAAQAWNLATTARLTHPWRMDHSHVAWNYRMGEINAAVGVAQLERLDGIIGRKRALAQSYSSAFRDIDGTQIVREAEGCFSNYWLNCLLLDEMQWAKRDEVLAALHSDGIACRTLFTPLFEFPFFKTCPRDNLESTMNIWRRAICLPSSPHLGG